MVAYKSMENKRLQIGEVKVAHDAPVVIIAELACEHRGNMTAAKRLVDAAHAAGADIAKFQLHVPEAEMLMDHPRMHFWAGSMRDVLKEVNFGTAREHRELKEYCEKIGIQYLCTPFCAKAVDILLEVGVAAFKTGSGELTNLPMLRHIARTGHPAIISTGMSTLSEIQDAVSVMRDENASFMLTHCLSEYPARYEHMNLRLIPELENRFNVLVGSSDHSTEEYCALAAVTLGAPLIEKHFTIRDLHGPDDLVSLDPTEFTAMVNAVRNIEKALGAARYVSDAERTTRDWAHHSIVSIADIKEGEVLSLENVAAKRPGGGIPASHLDPLYGDVLGKRAAHAIDQDSLILWEDITG